MPLGQSPPLLQYAGSWRWKIANKREPSLKAATGVRNPPVSSCASELLAIVFGNSRLRCHDVGSSAFVRVYCKLRQASASPPCGAPARSCAGRSRGSVAFKSSLPETGYWHAAVGCAQVSPNKMCRRGSRPTLALKPRSVPYTPGSRVRGPIKLHKLQLRALIALGRSSRAVLAAAGSRRSRTHAPTCDKSSRLLQNHVQLCLMSQ